MAVFGPELRCGQVQKEAHLYLVSIDTVAWLVRSFDLDEEILSSNPSPAEK
jgi:hypothetical protein